MHNHKGTTYLENLNDAWMTLGACCHSDALQESVYVVVDMQVTELQ